jgi:methyl-accepting chemotaxis protein
VAQGGNGADLGAIYQLLSEVAQTVRSHSDEFGHIHRNMDGLNRGVDDLSASVADLRAAVTEYHATVVGHGILYSELEQRIRRIERHLKLDPAA